MQLPNDDYKRRADHLAVAHQFDQHVRACQSGGAHIELNDGVPHAEALGAYIIGRVRSVYLVAPRPIARGAHASVMRLSPAAAAEIGYLPWREWKARGLSVVLRRAAATYTMAFARLVARYGTPSPGAGKLSQAERLADAVGTPAARLAALITSPRSDSFELLRARRAPSQAILLLAGAAPGVLIMLDELLQQRGAAALSGGASPLALAERSAVVSARLREGVFTVPTDVDWQLPPAGASAAAPLAAAPAVALIYIVEVSLPAEAWRAEAERVFVRGERLSQATHKPLDLGFLILLAERGVGARRRPVRGWPRRREDQRLLHWQGVRR